MTLYAFDGTNNEDRANNQKDSHIVRISDGYRDGESFYIPGVGTRFGAVGKFFGTVFGAGGQRRIEEMLAHFKAAHQPGNPVDIIGYSRGAALAVHFANVLNEDRVPVRFLGLFDVVASFGIPGNEINKNFIVDLVPENVVYCAHAMAYDERRHNFLLSRQTAANTDKTTLIETWFRGVHSDIGGTAIAKDTTWPSPKGRTAISLLWMCEQAVKANVSISQDLIDQAAQRMDAGSPININKDPVREPRDRTRTPRAGDRFHPSAEIRELEPNESVTVRCHSRVRFNPSNILVKQGQVFDFHVDPGQFWHDAEIRCTADGWETEDETTGVKRWLVEKGEDKRRVQEENWFKLIGSLTDVDDAETTPVDQRATFAIGSALENFTIPRDGELYTYANDLKKIPLLDLYTNNTGFIDITITRKH